jgi:hypothetical protein
MERRADLNKENDLTARTNAGASAGKLPESVMTRYDLWGVGVRVRLQYTYK